VLGVFSELEGLGELFAVLLGEVLEYEVIAVQLRHLLHVYHDLHFPLLQPLLLLSVLVHQPLVIYQLAVLALLAFPLLLLPGSAALQLWLRLASASDSHFLELVEIDCEGHEFVLAEAFEEVSEVGSGELAAEPLELVYALVEQYGGSVELDGQEGGVVVDDFLFEEVVDKLKILLGDFGGAGDGDGVGGSEGVDDGRLVARHVRLD